MHNMQRKTGSHVVTYLPWINIGYKLIINKKTEMLNYHKSLNRSLVLPVYVFHVSNLCFPHVIRRTLRISTVSVYARSGAAPTVTCTCLWLHWSACSTRPPAGQREKSSSWSKVRNFLRGIFWGTFLLVDHSNTCTSWNIQPPTRHPASVRLKDGAFWH